MCLTFHPIHASYPFSHSCRHPCPMLCHPCFSPVLVSILEGLADERAEGLGRRLTATQRGPVERRREASGVERVWTLAAWNMEHGLVPYCENFICQTWNKNILWNTISNIVETQLRSKVRSGQNQTRNLGLCFSFSSHI